MGTVDPNARGTDAAPPSRRRHPGPWRYAYPDEIPNDLTPKELEDICSAEPEKPQAPVPSPLDDNPEVDLEVLAGWLAGMAAVAQRLRQLDGALNGVPVSSARVGLALLAQPHPMYIEEIATAVSIDQSQVSRLVRSMDANDWLHRVRKGSKVEIRLDEEGEEFIEDWAVVLWDGLTPITKDERGRAALDFFASFAATNVSLTRGLRKQAARANPVESLPDGKDDDEHGD